MRTVKPAPPGGGTIGPPVQLTTGLACDTVPDAGEAASDDDGTRPQRIAPSAAESTAERRHGDPREETGRLMDGPSEAKNALPIQNMSVFMNLSTAFRHDRRLLACHVPVTAARPSRATSWTAGLAPSPEIPNGHSLHGRPASLRARLPPSA